MGSYQSGQLGLTVTQLSFDFGGSNPSLPTNRWDDELIWWCDDNVLIIKLSHYHIITSNRESSSVDRALAFQAEGRGFESRLSLTMRDVSLPGRKVYPDKVGKSRLSLSEKRIFLFFLIIEFCSFYCCCSSVVEHFLGKEEVASSILINSSIL